MDTRTGGAVLDAPRSVTPTEKTPCESSRARAGLQTVVRQTTIPQAQAAGDELSRRRNASGE